MCRSSKLGMVYFLVYSKSQLTIIAHRAVFLLCMYEQCTYLGTSQGATVREIRHFDVWP